MANIFLVSICWVYVGTPGDTTEVLNRTRVRRRCGLDHLFSRRHLWSLKTRVLSQDMVFQVSVLAQSSCMSCLGSVSSFYLSLHLSRRTV